MLFFLTGCESISLNKQYTEFYTIDGVGYYCEYIHGEKINCQRKEEENEKKIQSFAFIW